MSTLRYGEIFDRAWLQIRDRLPLVAGLSFLYLLAVSAFSQAPVIGILLSGFFHAGYIVCLLKVRDKNEMSFEDFFWAFADMNRLLQLVVLLILNWVMLGLGFICLVIPGIYLAVALSLAFPYFVTRNQDAMESLKASLKMCKNHWWSMLGLFILIGFLNLAGALCFLVGILISIPMSVFILLEAMKVLEGQVVPTQISAPLATPERSDF